jgi:hypothetical protein
MELLELNESVRTILERGQTQAATRNISLEYVPHGQVVPLRGNQNMVERILMILIDNAIRYSSPGGKIWIQTWSRSNIAGSSFATRASASPGTIMNLSSKDSSASMKRGRRAMEVMALGSRSPRV